MNIIKSNFYYLYENRALTIFYHSSFDWYIFLCITFEQFHMISSWVIEMSKSRKDKLRNAYIRGMV